MSEVINGFMGVSMEKIRSMVDANTMMGSPINCADGTTVIPVSKVSLGFASGGSDLPTRTSKEYFAGGAGAGITVKPQGFLVIKDGDVRLVQLSMDADKGNVMLNMIPEVVDKITALIPKKKKKGEEEALAEEEAQTSEE